MVKTKLELLILALTAQLKREPTEDELLQFIRGDSGTRIKIWNGQPALKVTIKSGVWKKTRKVWWVRCLRCDVKFHVHLKHWPLALEEANKHVQGKKHQHQLQGEKR